MRVLVAFTVFCVCLGIGRDIASADTLTVGCDFQHPIPADGDGPGRMEPAYLWVNRHITIEDIDIYLDITHPRVSDLEILLDGPSGQTITLKDVWETPWRTLLPNMYTTVFDDEAETSLIDGIPPYRGDFLPVAGNQLSVFDGLDGYGQWTLRIYDGYAADAGVLDHWELQITHTPEPISLIYLLGALPYILSRRKYGNSN